MKHTPNIITVLRIFAAPFLVAAILRGDYGLALCLVAAMGVSDGLDGFLAKQFGWRTVVGARIDPLADKLMLVSSFVALAVVGLAPVWFVVLVAARDLVLMAWGVSQWWAGDELVVRPIWWSKVNTVCQIMLVFAVLAGPVWPGFGFLADFLTPALLYVTAVMTVVSGLAYLQKFSPGEGAAHRTAYSKISR